MKPTFFSFTTRSKAPNGVRQGQCETKQPMKQTIDQTRKYSQDNNNGNNNYKRGRRDPFFYEFDTPHFAKALNSFFDAFNNQRGEEFFYPRGGRPYNEGRPNSEYQQAEADTKGKETESKEISRPKSSKVTTSSRLTDDHFVVSLQNADHFDPKELNIEIKDGMLTLSGKKHEESDKDGVKTYSSHSFMHSMTIPSNCDTNASKASFKNGVLDIKIPRLKIEEETSFQVPINFAKKE